MWDLWVLSMQSFAGAQDRFPHPTSLLRERLKKLTLKLFRIGVLSQIAPGRGGDVSRLALSALISGALSTFTSASIAGLVITEQEAYFTPSAASQ